MPSRTPNVSAPTPITLYFKHLNVTAYMSVWNLYVRKNIASYYWNEIENKADQSYQRSILPAGGIEVEFSSAYPACAGRCQSPGPPTLNESCA